MNEQNSPGGELNFELAEKIRYETIDYVYSNPDDVLNTKTFTPKNKEGILDIIDVTNVRPYRTNNPVSYYQIDSGFTLKKYSDYTPKLDVEKDKKVYHIGTDSFTNSTLISFLLGRIYQNEGTETYGLDGYNLNYKSYVLKNDSGLTGYQITNATQYTLIDYFKDVSKNIIEVYHKNSTKKVPVIPKAEFLNVLKQVMSNLLYLKTFNFKGNRVTVNNIAIINDEVNINYNNINVKSNIMTLISNFDYSELKTEHDGKQYHFYPNNEINIQPVFKTSLGYHQMKSWSTFRINEVSGNQVPVEWDTVTFITSLLMIPEVYYLVISDLDLERYLIREVFHPNDIEYFLTKIRDIVKNKSKITYSLVRKTLKEVRFIQSV